MIQALLLCISIDLKNINLDDNNIDEDDLEHINHVRFMASYKTFKQRKTFLKNQQILFGCSMAPKKRYNLEL